MPRSLCATASSYGRGGRGPGVGVGRGGRSMGAEGSTPDIISCLLGSRSAERASGAGGSHGGTLGNFGKRRQRGGLQNRGWGLDLFRPLFGWGRGKGRVSSRRRHQEMMGVRKQEAMHKGAGSRVSAKVGHLVSLGMLQP